MITPSIVLAHSKDPVSKVDLSSEYGLFASTQTGDLLHFDLNTRKLNFSFKLHQDNVLDFLLYDDKIISLSKDGFLKKSLFDCSSLIPLDSLKINHCSFCNIQYNKHLNCVFMPSARQSALSFVDFRSWKCCNEFIPASSHGMLTRILSIDPNSNILLHEDGTLTCLDVRNMLVLSQLSLAGDEPYFSMDFANHKKIGVAGTMGKSLAVFRLIDGGTLELMTKFDIVNPGCCSITFRPDEKLFACGCCDSKVRLYSAKSLKHLALLTFHKGNVNTVAFCKKSQYLACGSSDKIISVWKLFVND